MSESQSAQASDRNTRVVSNMLAWAQRRKEVVTTAVNVYRHLIELEGESASSGTLIERQRALILRMISHTEDIGEARFQLSVQQAKADFLRAVSQCTLQLAGSWTSVADWSSDAAQRPSDDRSVLGEAEPANVGQGEGEAANLDSDHRWPSDPEPEKTRHDMMFERIFHWLIDRRLRPSATDPVRLGSAPSVGDQRATSSRSGSLRVRKSAR